MKRFVGRSMAMLICALVLIIGGAGRLAAQMSEEKARALVYHDGVLENPDTAGIYLTRNSLDTVKAYYQGLKGKMDTVRAWEEERGTGSVGYTVTYNYSVQGSPPMEWAGATFWKIDEEKYRKQVASQPGGAFALETAQSIPLSQLKVVLQNKTSGHTQAEYDGLVRKYRHLQFSFFRQVKDDKGELQPEDKAVYDRCSKRVYGGEGGAAAPLNVGGDDKAKQQRRKETGARIKELKKQGKTAEAMELAMQMQQEMMSGGAAMPSGAIVPGPARKDAWDIWVRCLEDASKVAYPVRIEAGSAMYPGLK